MLHLYSVDQIVSGLMAQLFLNDQLCFFVHWLRPEAAVPTRTAHTDQSSVIPWEEVQEYHKEVRWPIQLVVVGECGTRGILFLGLLR